MKKTFLFFVISRIYRQIISFRFIQIQSWFSLIVSFAHHTLFFGPTKWCSLWAAWISTKIVIFSILWHLFPKHFAPWSTWPNTKPRMRFCLSYISRVIDSFWIWFLSSIYIGGHSFKAPLIRVVHHRYESRFRFRLEKRFQPLQVLLNGLRLIQKILPMSFSQLMKPMPSRNGFCPYGMGFAAFALTRNQNWVNYWPQMATLTEESEVGFPLGVPENMLRWVSEMSSLNQRSTGMFLAGLPDGVTMFEKPRERQDVIGTTKFIRYTAWGFPSGIKSIIFVPTIQSLRVTISWFHQGCQVSSQWNYWNSASILMFWFILM